MEINKVNDLSFYSDQGILTIPAKQYDTGRKFSFNIIADDTPLDLSNCIAYLRILKADGTQFQGEDCCSISGSIITVDTSVSNGEQILTCAGLNQCEIHLRDNNGKSLTTWPFNIEVVPRVHDGSHMASIDSWDSWDKMKDNVYDFSQKINDHYFVLTVDIGVANGIPNLNSEGKIPISELYEATTDQKGIIQLLSYNEVMDILSNVETDSESFENEISNTQLSM